MSPVLLQSLADCRQDLASVTVLAALFGLLTLFLAIWLIARYAHEHADRHETLLVVRELLSQDEVDEVLGELAQEVACDVLDEAGTLARFTRFRNFASSQQYRVYQNWWEYLESYFEEESRLGGANTRRGQTSHSPISPQN